MEHVLLSLKALVEYYGQFAFELCWEELFDVRNFQSQLL